MSDSYFLFARLVVLTCMWEVFYVGQAINIKTRLLQHLSGNEENECINEHVEQYECRFVYAMVSKKENRDGIEKYLFEQYNTECNEISPPDVDPIIVNLPNL